MKSIKNTFVCFSHWLLLIHTFVYSLLNFSLGTLFQNKDKMEGRYSRNRIYVRPEEKQIVKYFRFLFGGAGIGN